MSTRIEDLIRQAQAYQAERAVAPDRIHAALPARAARVARRRRNGTLVAAVSAAAVAVAVTVPVVALRGGTSGHAQNSAASPAASTSQPPPVVPTLPGAQLRYRPTWLPDGLVERRWGTFGSYHTPGAWGGVYRTWTRDPINAEGMPEFGKLQLQLSVRQIADGEQPPKRPGAKVVDINGVPGLYHDAGWVTWSPEPGILLSLEQPGRPLSPPQVELQGTPPALRGGAIVAGTPLPDDGWLSEDDLLRVARSVRPDSTQLTSPFRFGWLPDRLTMSSVSISGNSPTSWQAGASGDGHRAYLAVVLGTATTAPAGGETFVVGGRPARFVSRSYDNGVTEGYVVVDLDSGLLLTLVGEAIDRDDLMAIAEHIEVGPAPDVSWLGRR